MVQSACLRIGTSEKDMCSAFIAYTSTNGVYKLMKQPFKPMSYHKVQ